MRWPGIEPGSTAWKGTMLAFTPQTHVNLCSILTYQCDYDSKNTKADTQVDTIFISRFNSDSKIYKHISGSMV